MSSEEATYYNNLCKSWDEKFIDRSPRFCSDCKCKHVIKHGQSFTCQLILDINKDIKVRIDDWNNAQEKYDYKCKWFPAEKGRQWILTSFLRNAHNIYYSEDDYFPTHKVPDGCPFSLEYIIYQGQLKK